MHGMRIKSHKNYFGKTTGQTTRYWDRHEGSKTEATIPTPKEFTLVVIQGGKVADLGTRREEPTSMAAPRKKSTSRKNSSVLQSMSRPMPSSSRGKKSKRTRASSGRSKK